MRCNFQPLRVLCRKHKFTDRHIFTFSSGYSSLSSALAASPWSFWSPFGATGANKRRWMPLHADTGDDVLSQRILSYWWLAATWSAPLWHCHRRTVKMILHRQLTARLTRDSSHPADTQLKGKLSWKYLENKNKNVCCCSQKLHFMSSNATTIQCGTRGHAAMRPRFYSAASAAATAVATAAAAVYRQGGSL